MIPYITKLVLRYLWSQKFYSILSVLGFIIAFTASMIIFKYVVHELSFDKHVKGHEQVYRLQFGNKLFINGKSVGLIKNNIPGVEHVCPIQARGSLSISTIDGKYKVSGSVYNTNHEWQSVFQTNTTEGKLNDVFNNDALIAISQNTAMQLFGNESPIGKNLIVNKAFGPGIKKKVAAVYIDVPDNSSIAPIGLVSISSLAYHNKQEKIYSVFIKLSNNSSSHIVEQSILQHLTNGGEVYDAKVSLTSLSEIRFTKQNSFDYISKSNRTYIYLFAFIGLLILFTSIVNYQSFRIGKYKSRLQSIRIARYNGAHKRHVKIQYFIESMLIILCSAIVTYVVFQVLMVANANSLFGVKLSNNASSNILIVCLISLLTLLSLALIPFRNLISMLSNETLKLNDRLCVGLINIQFFIAFLLVVSSIVVYHQKEFLLDFDTGLNTDRVISLQLSSSMMKDADAFKDELLNYSGISDVTFASNGPENIEYVSGYSNNQQISYGLWVTDDNFLNFFNIKMIKGRGFSQMPGDAYSFIINEKALHSYDWESYLNKNIDGVMGKQCIGVCEDFHFASLHNEVAPLVILCNYNILNRVYVRYNDNALMAIKHLQECVNKFLPEQLFNYQFLSDTLDAYYTDELKIFKLLSSFSLLALVIALIGMMGMTSIVIQERTKEIGIRKVNGASSLNIVFFLNKKISVPILTGFILSIAPVLYFMEQWLQIFSQHISIRWYYFLIGGLFVWIINSLVMIVQTKHAVNQNPVKCLRYE
ncbi:ABC transporter permease [Carboxylicivirga sp. N1Y90]|uniref:ABC transporter permease n=1 Tax=Carboxylicivirga fragile TaxID=3417571 RepID=UPI003D34123E|nr:ABC transporter permease [Marinilabiliaceae bacterium N1Y90]